MNVIVYEDSVDYLRLLFLVSWQKPGDLDRFFFLLGSVLFGPSSSLFLILAVLDDSAAIQSLISNVASSGALSFSNAFFRVREISFFIKKTSYSKSKCHIPGLIQINSFLLHHFPVIRDIFSLLLSPDGLFPVGVRQKVPFWI